MEEELVWTVEIEIACSPAVVVVVLALQQQSSVELLRRVEAMTILVEGQA